MRKFILAAAVAAIASLPAPARAHDKVFSACNVAVGGSYGWAKVDVAGTPFASEGVAAILSGGCDLTISKLVLGGWASYSHGAVDANILGTNAAVSRQIAYGARAGMMLTKDMLLYGTLGWAQGNIAFKDNGASVDRNIAGLRIGAGAEYRIMAPAWLRIEAAQTLYNSEAIDGTKVQPKVTTLLGSLVFKF